MCLLHTKPRQGVGQTACPNRAPALLPGTHGLPSLTVGSSHSLAEGRIARPVVLVAVDGRTGAPSNGQQIRYAIKSNIRSLTLEDL